MIVRVAVALAVVVAVAGCTDEDAASPTTLPRPTSSPTESPKPTELPTPPAEAKAHTPDGAAAFVRFYIELINDAYETGVSEPLRAYATDECEICESSANAVDDIYGEGGRAAGGVLTINSLTPTGVAEGVQTSVFADTSASAYQQFDQSGDLEASHAAESRNLLFDLVWSGAWKIEAIRESESPA